MESVRSRFDELNQLVEADHAGSRDDEAYTLDATGNRDDSNYDVEARNLTSTDGTYDYEYDGEGNRIKRTEISSGDYEEYEWDHRNRLVSIKWYDSGGGSSTQTITYSYDAFNRLTQRSFDADGDGSGTATDTFFAGFDGLGATLEFDDDSASDLSHRYLWGPDDQLLADEIVDSLTTEGEILWALADQVGTIRDIGTWNDTSSEYEIANHRVYDSFGNLTDETNSSVDLAFGFTGRWTDPTTGLTHHLNRWFDSSIGKWLSNDPIGFGGGDANVQRYVVNNPLQFVDNNGLDKSPPGGGGGGGDDVMGVSGINQGADQGGVPAGSTRLDEDNTVAMVSIDLGTIGPKQGIIQPQIPYYDSDGVMGFWSSIGASCYSIGLTYWGIGQYIGGDAVGAEATWNDAYELSPFGQTKDDDGIFYYGTRLALGGASVAAGGAAVSGIWAWLGLPQFTASVSFGGASPVHITFAYGTEGAMTWAQGLGAEFFVTTTFAEPGTLVLTEIPIFFREQLEHG